MDLLLRTKIAWALAIRSEYEEALLYDRYMLVVYMLNSAAIGLRPHDRARLSVRQSAN